MTQKNFKITNGLEVNNNLIFADTNSNKVGIATTVVNYNLHVNGGIGVTNLSVTGLSTFNNLDLTGYISIAGTTGKEGQSLVSTGAGVTWSKISKTSSVFTATVGQNTFNFSYEVGSVEVYVNGVRLSPNEFTATNGTTVVLNDNCFGDETVEIVGSVFDNAIINGWMGTTEGTLYRISNVGIGTTLPSSKLTVQGDVYSSGVITATQGFISVGNTTPIQISLVGNQLIFTAVGIGSTTLTLF
jgi:hypothetical protein